MNISNNSRRINFLPEDLRPKFTMAGGISASILVLSLAAYCITSITRYTAHSGDLKLQLDVLTARASEVDSKVAQLSKQLQISSENNGIDDSIQSVLSKKNYWSEVFRELSAIIPEGISLTQFNNLKTAVPNSETRLILVGEAESQGLVAQFLTTLERTRRFAGIQLKSSIKEANILPYRYRFEFSTPVKVLTGGGSP